MNAELQPLVSVITPAYNAEQYIAEAIDSVRAQSYSNWEMLIVDDCSTDKTQEIIRRYADDKRIRIISLENNSGAAVARNTAIKNANGHFIAFLDADDKWKPQKLEVQITYMQKMKIGFSFSEYEYIPRSTDEITKPFMVPDTLNYKQALKNTVIGCLTVVLDTDIIGKFEMPLVRRGQDNLTWLMLLKNGTIAYGIHESLAEYRRVEGSLSNSKIKAMKRQWNNYRKEVGLSFLPCVYYYLCYAVNGVVKYIRHR